MSYLFIVVIGAIVGFVVGQYVKGTEHGSGLDAAIGAVGGCLAVVLSRVVGPAAAAGFVMSAIVTIIGAVIAVYGTRHFKKAKPVPVKPARRRY